VGALRDTSCVVKLSQLLQGVLRIDPAADAIEFQRQWHSWGELARSIDAIGVCLEKVALGGGGSRLGVFVRKRPDALAAVLTAIRNEGCLISINPLLPDARARCRRPGRMVARLESVAPVEDHYGL
jgi:long-chain acyl-CoA synthetase